MYHQKGSFKGFTLVELIVVITILAILGTIAIMAFSGYSKNARDSARISDITNMKKSLELWILQSGSYPEPSNGASITYSGAIVWTQGTYGDSVTSTVGKLDKKPTDPLYDAEYTYSVTNSKKEYQIGALLEKNMAFIDSKTGLPNFGVRPVLSSIIPQTYAATSGVEAYVSGNYNGVVISTQTGGLYYMLATPSIILSDLTDTNITGTKQFVLSKKSNLPHSYANKQLTMTGTEVDFAPTVVWTGTGYANLNNQSQFQNLVTNLQTAYSDPLFATLPEYISIASTANLAPEAMSAVKSIIEINTKQILSDVTTIPVYNNCTSTIYSGFTIPAINHLDSQNVTKSVANGTADITATCTNGTLSYNSENVNCLNSFVLQGGVCVADTCPGNAPEFSISNGTQSINGTWNHTAIPGVCSFVCQAGYYWNGATCASASLGNYVTNSGSTSQIACTTGQYQDELAQTTYKLCTNKPANANYTSSTALTSNTCPWSCDSGYYENGGTCYAYVNGACSGIPSNVTYYNNTNTYSLVNALNGTSLTASYNATPTANTCQFKCNANYSGTSCEIYTAPTTSSCIGANNPTPFSAPTTYDTCDTPDIIVCSGNAIGYTIAACNVGTSIAGTASSSYGNYFQWGNNGGTPSGTLTPSNATVNATGYGPGNYYNSTIFIGGTGINNWANPQNDDLWGNTTNTNEARQGPCALGYHVPLPSEWSGLRTAGGWGTNGTNFKNALKLPMSGLRSKTNGAMANQGTYGYYWSSSPLGTNADGLNFYASNITTSGTNSHSNGYTVRCFKN